MQKVLIAKSLDFFKQKSKDFLDLVFPDICICCKSQEQITRFQLCKKCFSTLDCLSNYPHCYACGHKIKKGNTCIACQLIEPFFEDAASLFLYDAKMQKMVKSLKFGDQTLFAKFAAEALAGRFKKQIEEADFILPIPIHPFRLFRRKYNQSALIANYIKKIIKTSININALKKVKNTKPQARLGFSQRRLNMQNAFKVTDKKHVEGKNIILLDDVITTGATISGCAELLKKNGAKKITAMSLARSLLFDA